MIRCVGFDAASDFTGTHGDNHGTLPGADNQPARDTSVRASGASSLHFRVSSSTANSGGSYFTNFSDDLLTQLGANETFYVQWRQRFSPSYLALNPPGAGGWKLAIIGQGDKPGCTASTSANGQCASSCTPLEVVTQNTNLRGFAQMYNSCTGSTSHGPYNAFEESFGSFDFKLQNARPSPYCLYSQSGAGRFPPGGNCFGFFANEWMTFQVQITTGPRVNDEWQGSRVRLWIARDGQPSELALDWGPYALSAGAPSADLKFGKVWLLPYDTNTTTPVSLTPGDTWYDELIVSRNRIADPGASGGAGGGSGGGAAGGGSTGGGAAGGGSAGGGSTGGGAAAGGSAGGAAGGSSGGAAGGATSVIAVQARAMARGTWAQVTPTPSGLMNFVGGNHSGLRTGYADKMAYDAAGGRLFFIGCDHNQDQIFLQYDEATNAWAVQPTTPFAAATKHGYDHTVWDSTHGVLYHRPAYDLSVRSWAGGGAWNTSSFASSLAYHSFAVGLEWFPDLGANGRLLVFQLENGTRGALIGLDPVTNTWTTYVSGASTTLDGTGDPHNFARYSPTHHLVWFGGGNGSQKTWRINQTGVISPSADIPPALGTVGPGGLGSSLAFLNPADGSFIVIRNASTWYSYDPVADTWTPRPGTAAIASGNVFDATEPIWGVVAAPMPAYGVVAFVKAVSRTAGAEMWLYKP